MIAIKDMEMPTECEYCGLCRYYPENGNVWCNANNRILKLHWKDADWTHLDVERPDWCPLIEIKTDGDTISRQAVLDKIRAEIEPTRKMYLEMNDIDWINGCDYVLQIIDKYKAESEVEE